jgi:hypothetical protein
MEDYTQQENVGSIARMVLVGDDGFDSEPVYGKWKEITLKGDAFFTEFLFSHGSCGLTCKQESSVNGFLYSASVVCSVPKMSDTLRQWLFDNAERRWVAFCEDANGFTHIVGSPKIGCRLGILQSTGIRRANKNENVIVLQGASIYPFIVLPVIDILIVPEFSDEFSDEFNT